MMEGWNEVLQGEIKVSPFPRRAWPGQTWDVGLSSQSPPLNVEGQRPKWVAILAFDGVFYCMQPRVERPEVRTGVCGSRYVPLRYLFLDHRIHLNSSVTSFPTKLLECVRS